MKKILSILLPTLCLMTAYPGYAEKKEAEAWEVHRTIPVPDQASEEIIKGIVSRGQPDVEARKNAKVPTKEEWIKFTRAMGAMIAGYGKQLAGQLDIKVTEEKMAGVSVYYVDPPKVDEKNKQRLFIHVHGGGYVSGSGPACVVEAINIAHYTKMRVLSVDYRMPPNHPFPAAVDDTLAVYKELIKTHPPKTMAIGGTSAGGGLALAMIHKFKAEGLEVPGAVFGGTPWTDLTKTGDSYFTNEGLDLALVSYEGLLKGMADIYVAEHDIRDPLISPVYGDFDGFPPTILVTGTRDLFLSNTARVHRKLKVAGVVADLNVYEGTSHADYIRPFGSPENVQTFTELSDFLDAHLE